MEIPGDGSKGEGVKRLSSDVGEPSSGSDKVRKVTGQAFQSSKKTGNNSFSATKQSEESSFPTVSYVDLGGLRTVHPVHNDQIPFPPFISDDEGLKDTVKVLNNMDYEVCLNVNNLDRDLEINLKVAKENVKKGTDAYFNTNVPELIPRAPLLYVAGYENRIHGISFETKEGVGVATAQGCRDSMEDRFFVSDDISAVFDGHGGKECAVFAKENFASFFQKRMEDPSLASMEQKLKIFNAINLSCVDLSRSYLKEKAGTTANIVFRFGRELWIANLGDSRALFVTPEVTTQLSKDQKAESDVELIEARGAGVQQGRVSHPSSGYGVIPSRGFGDHHLRGAISSRPVISLFPIPKRKEPCYLVQASDGVFDVASSAQIGELVRKCSKKGFTADQIAAVVAQRALERGASDNITVIVKTFV